MSELQKVGKDVENQAEMNRDSCSKTRGRKSNPNKVPSSKYEGSKFEESKFDEAVTSLDACVPNIYHLSVPLNMSSVHGISGIKQPQENETRSFPYKPLSMSNYDVEQSEIRLLLLKPGLKPSPIECSVENLAIAEARSLKFRALSYTWGPPEETETVLLEGIRVQVRKNLWQALYYLRSADTELCLWIDALSINQDDVEERNNQVSMMGLIYNKSVEVFVWLGPESHSSKVNYFGLGYFSGSSKYLHGLSSIF
jgi:hypothetical protein